MELIKCPHCGESYSPSYPRCPFCEEDGDDTRIIKRPSRRLTNRRKLQSARGSLIVVLALVLALLGLYLFGDRIFSRGGQETPDPPEAPIGQHEDDPPSPPVPSEVVIVEPPVVADVSNAALNREDFTLSGAGTKFTIQLSGTEATPTWSIDNANVATILMDGTVVAVANGDTTVRCKVGERELTCTVRVRNTGRTADKAAAPMTAEPLVPVAPAQPGGEDGTAHVDASSLGLKTDVGGKLGKASGTDFFDCTVRKGESVTLIVTGTTVPASGWTSDNAAVVTVDANGRLTPVKAGDAKVTATVGDATVTCIVRVHG